MQELGISSLKKRFTNQQDEAIKYKDHINNIFDVINAIALSNAQLSTKFDSLRDRQMGIYQQLLSIMRKIEVLRCHGTPVQAAEIK